MCDTLDGFPDVVAVLWVDNMYFVGPLRQAALAARHFRNAIAHLGLRLNDQETVADVPAGLDFPRVKAVLDFIGIKILGVPFGSDAFIASELAETVSKISEDMPKIAVMRDGLMHYHPLKM